MQCHGPDKTCLNVGPRQCAQHRTFFFHEILYISVSPGIGIEYSCTALRYKPAFIATWQSVGLSRGRPGFNPLSWQNLFFHLLQVYK